MKCLLLYTGNVASQESFIDLQICLLQTYNVIQPGQPIVHEHEIDKDLLADFALQQVQPFNVEAYLQVQCDIRPLNTAHWADLMTPMFCNAYTNSHVPSVAMHELLMISLRRTPTVLIFHQIQLLIGWLSKPCFHFLASSRCCIMPFVTSSCFIKHPPMQSGQNCCCCKDWLMGHHFSCPSKNIEFKDDKCQLML